jgi:hypothetical protein
VVRLFYARQSGRLPDSICTSSPLPNILKINIQNLN